MATNIKLSPEDEFRRLKGLAPDAPVPVSLESHTIPRGEARNLEVQRDRKPTRVQYIGPAPVPTGHAAASGPRPMSTLEAARSVLDEAALASDIATVGLAAGGVTAPIAGAAKGLGWAAEGGLGLVNAYDAVVNGNWGPLQAQGANLPARLLPGGRALRGALKTVRGPTGLLRDGAGRFRRSVLDNKAIEKAGNIATERYLGAISDRFFNQ